VPGGNAVSGVWADKQMTAKAREATYESLHATASTRIQTLENMLEAERESNLLKFEEIESDKYSMLEVEELNQAAFDNVRSELKKSHGNLNADVNTLQVSYRLACTERRARTGESNRRDANDPTLAKDYRASQRAVQETLVIVHRPSLARCRSASATTAPPFF